MKDDEDYYVKDSKIYTKDENGEFTKIFANIDKKGKIKKNKTSDTAEIFGWVISFCIQGICLLFAGIGMIGSKIVSLFRRKKRTLSNERVITEAGNKPLTRVKVGGDLIITYDNQQSIVEDNQTIIIKVDDYQAQLRQFSREVEDVRKRRTRLITAVCIFACIFLFEISTLLII